MVRVDGVLKCPNIKSISNQVLKSLTLIALIWRLRRHSKAPTTLLPVDEKKPANCPASGNYRRYLTSGDLREDLRSDAV